jgi:hypothetical protein
MAPANATCPPGLCDWYPLVSHSPHSSGERATASGAVSAGSNPAGGAPFVQRKMHRDLRRCRNVRCHAWSRYATGCCPVTGAAPHTRPKSWLLQVQALVHAADPDAFQAGDAPGVDAHEHLDGVTGPGGDLSGGDAGVEPPGDPGVARVVGVSSAGRRAGRGERGGPDLLPDLPPRWRAGSGFLSRTGTACRRGRCRMMRCARGGARRARAGWGPYARAAGGGARPAFGAALEAAVLVDLAVVGAGPACGGLASAKVR